MKILIICDMFPPAFGPRMGYLCKYMKRAGWEPVVVTEYINDSTFSFLTENIDVFYVKFYHAVNIFLKKIEWITILLLDIFFHYKDKKIAQKAASLLDKGGFDGILCSTYRTFPLPAAVRVAQKYKLPIIADLRDIIEQYAENEFIANPPHFFPWLDNQIICYFRKKLLNDRNKALKYVNYITTVSPWHVETIKKINPNTKLIYNGYDPELFYPKQYKTSKFSITFTGRLISLQTRNPQLLFEAVKILKEKKLISTNSFRIQWFTDLVSQSIIKKEVEKYGIEDYMDYFDYKPAIEIPKILNTSSILLQLANLQTKRGPKGFMTTKLFEALAVEKPILCIRSDEACLERTIEKTHSGIAAKKTEDVIKFILEKYKEWEAKGFTTQRINKKEVSNYSRVNTCNQFIYLFNSLINSRNFI